MRKLNNLLQSRNSLDIVFPLTWDELYERIASDLCFMGIGFRCERTVRRWRNASGVQKKPLYRWLDYCQLLTYGVSIAKCNDAEAAKELMLINIQRHPEIYFRDENPDQTIEVEAKAA